MQTEPPTCCFKSAFSGFCFTEIAQNIFTPSLCPKNSSFLSGMLNKSKPQSAGGRIMHRLNILTLNFTFFSIVNCPPSLIVLHCVFFISTQVKMCGCCFIIRDLGCGQITSEPQVSLSNSLLPHRGATKLVPVQRDLKKPRKHKGKAKPRHHVPPFQTSG